MVWSADNLRKQFGPRSDPTKCWARSGSKLFDTLVVFLKEFFERVEIDKLHPEGIFRKKLILINNSEAKS